MRKNRSGHPLEEAWPKPCIRQAVHEDGQGMGEPIEDQYEIRDCHYLKGLRCGISPSWYTCLFGRLWERPERTQSGGETLVSFCYTEGTRPYKHEGEGD